MQFGWKKDGSVQDWLFAEGYRFDFFQAVRLLERISESAETAPSETKALEKIQLRSRVGFAFPPSEIHEVNRLTEGPYLAEVVTNFLSLAGTQGPLPDVFAELLIERNKHRDTALGDFLDIFHHRLLLLMYRVRQRHRQWLEWQRPELGTQAKYIYAFTGLGHPELHNRMDVPDAAVLSYAGLLWQKPRSAVGLESILTDFFGAKAKIQSMVGSWLTIEPDCATRIGRRGANQQLGQSAVVGTKVWDRQGCFDIVFEAMPIQKFLSFLPEGKNYAALQSLVKFYTNDQFQFRIQLSLRADDVPATYLSKSKLGWTSWMRKSPVTSKKKITVTGLNSKFVRTA